MRGVLKVILLVYHVFVLISEHNLSLLSHHALGIARKTRIIDVVYNASNNELVRTKTLVKNAIVVIDATPFRQWFESYYALPIGRKKSGKLVSALR